MKFIIAFIAFMGLALGFLFAPAQIFATQIAVVTVQPETLGKEIPRDFVGFSLEVSTAGQGVQAFEKTRRGGASAKPNEQIQYALGHPDAPNTAFFRFMRNLGPGVLRLGGNSQDNTCWDSKRAPHPDWCKAALGTDDMRLFAEAAKSSGWRVILGLNLKQNSPAWALREITEGVARYFSPEQVADLEIGNEPDLFRRGARPATYSPADHAHDFLGYVEAFHENPIARNYALAGPATCCQWRNARDLGVFIDGVGAKNLKLITVHNYSKTTCGGKTVTIAQLLDPALMSRFDKAAQAMVRAARERGLPIALAETNSASCGGMPGVSNAFASAVWGLDYMFSAAQDGFRNINFHISYRPGGSSYNAVDTYGYEDASHAWHYRNVAEPLYYAMYLFARNASGEHFVPASMKRSANINAFAVSSCVGCAVKVFVVNEDLKAAGSVRVRVAGRNSTASLLLLRAPTLSSRASEVSYGGVQFDSEGRRLPTIKSMRVISRADGDYTFDLPNASAAVLTVPAS